MGRPRTAAKSLDDLLLLGRHLFTPSPAVFDLHTLRRLALDDLPDHVRAMPLGMSAGRSPRRSPPDPRPPAPGAARGARSARAPRSADRPAPPLGSARLATASARSIWWFCTRFSRPVAPATRSSDRCWVLLALGSSSPATACACSPTCTLTRLTTRSRSVSSHRRCLGPPPAPCRAAPAPRGSGILACQLLPILGVSRVAGCGNRYLPRSSPSLSLPWFTTTPSFPPLRATRPGPLRPRSSPSPSSSVATNAEAAGH